MDTFISNDIWDQGLWPDVSVIRKGYDSTGSSDLDFLHLNLKMEIGYMLFMKDRYIF